MKYFSTNHQAPVTDFRDAAIRGQAPDKGLYFPERIPQIDPELIDSIEQVPDDELAFRLIRPYTGDTIPEPELRSIVKQTLNFPIPLVPVTDSAYSLELFHGPTLAFKDVGARFMSRTLGYFLGGGSKKVTVLVATSGDTGGAVASGFYGVEGVEVVILYPSGRVSRVQEKQLTAMGGNIRAIEINGSFDDCQSLVKQAFADPQLNGSLFLTSANSINIARWLPQQFYYLLAWKQWPDKKNPPVISVPSGNFGNICAGMLVHASGLPVGRFIAACNANDVVTRYLQTGKYEPAEAHVTISNAMDVGEPSNFIRILELVQHQLPRLKEKLSSVSVTDEETLRTIRELYNHTGYVADPHGAVAFFALQQWLGEHAGDKGLFLETAHPVKFPDAVKNATGTEPSVPSALAELMERPKQAVPMDVSFNKLKDYLLG